MMPRTAAAPLALVLLGLFAAPGGAQPGPEADALGSAWAGRWSPFSPVGDLPRSLPAPPRLPELLRLPAPRVGLFWTAGSPAGLALEAPEPYGAVELRFGGESGPYRRPLDPDDQDVRRLTGVRWQPVGERSTVIGHVLAEQVTAGVGAFSPQIAPHPSDPFVVADTTTSAMRLVRARLEGAVGWRSGAWTAGLAPGLEVADHRTQESTLPRIVRAASPGITAGIGRVFAGGGVAVAAHARWAATSETIRFIAWPALGVVYRLQGYGDPTPVQIGGSPSSLEFTRYSEHRALAGGLAASARLLGADWVVFGERTRRRDQHRNERRPDAPTDRWNADGWHLGLAAAGAVLDGRLRITASADYIALDGDALRADIADVIFDSRERALRTVIDVRFTPTAAPWMIAARVGFDHAQRDRWDYLVETGSEIGAWTSAFALEIARRLGQGTFLSASSGISLYQPRALLPSTAAVGPAYQRFIAPELALYGMAARPFTTTATLRHAVSEAVAVTLGGRADWLTPSGESTLPAAAAPSDGQRTRWHAAFGVAVTR